jgi:hypothetical protein
LFSKIEFNLTQFGIFSKNILATLAADKAFNPLWAALWSRLAFLNGVS